jgi:hypothetical protein
MRGRTECEVFEHGVGVGGGGTDITSGEGAGSYHITDGEGAAVRPSIEVGMRRCGGFQLSTDVIF